MTTLREAIDDLDLEAWLEQYVQLKDGGGDERRIEVCPKCGADDWKLYVNVEKKRWICYKCDWGRKRADGWAPDLAELMAAVSDRHETAIRIELLSTVLPAISGDPGLVQTLATLFAEPVSETRIYSPEAVVVPGAATFTGLTSQEVYQYATQVRGLRDAEIRALRLGAALRLPARKVNPVTGKVNEVRGPWLVFPIRVGQRDVAWQGRRIAGKEIKYLSSANVHDWLWPLEPCFFERYRSGGAVVLVEGVFDALGFLRYGTPALCTFGKSISEAQVELLRELRPGEIIFCWDADATRESVRSVERIKSAFPETRISIVNLIDETHSVKVDAGDALVNTSVVLWLAERLRDRIDARSSAYVQWRLSLLI